MNRHRAHTNQNVKVKCARTKETLKILYYFREVSQAAEPADKSSQVHFLSLSLSLSISY